jgi:hypothetical protein
MVAVAVVAVVLVRVVQESGSGVALGGQVMVRVRVVDALMVPPPPPPPTTARGGGVLPVRLVVVVGDTAVVGLVVTVVRGVRGDRRSGGRRRVHRDGGHGPRVCARLLSRVGVGERVATASLMRGEQLISAQRHDEDVILEVVVVAALAVYRTCAQRAARLRVTEMVAFTVATLVARLRDIFVRLT